MEEPIQLPFDFRHATRVRPTVGSMGERAMSPRGALRPHFVSWSAMRELRRAVRRAVMSGAGPMRAAARLVAGQRVLAMAPGAIVSIFVAVVMAVPPVVMMTVMPSSMGQLMRPVVAMMSMMCHVPLAVPKTTAVRVLTAVPMMPVRVAMAGPVAIEMLSVMREFMTARVCSPMFVPAMMPMPMMRAAMSELMMSRVHSAVVPVGMAGQMRGAVMMVTMVCVPGVSVPMVCGILRVARRRGFCFVLAIPRLVLACSGGVMLCEARPHRLAFFFAQVCEAAAAALAPRAVAGSIVRPVIGAFVGLAVLGTVGSGVPVLALVARQRQFIAGRRVDGQAGRNGRAAFGRGIGRLAVCAKGSQSTDNNA
jgi:hypothetical protein